MKQTSQTLAIRTSGRHFYDVTRKVLDWVSQSDFKEGLLTLHVQHTSASLLINENYDPDVLVDLESFFERLVLDGDPIFIHTAEAELMARPASLSTTAYEATNCELCVAGRKPAATQGTKRRRAERA